MAEEGGDCTDERELDRGRGKEDAAVAEGANNASRRGHVPACLLARRKLDSSAQTLRRNRDPMLDSSIP